MIYNTFTTKEEADGAQEQDYELFITGGDPEWVATTQRWAEVIELPDGRWGYTPFPSSPHLHETCDITIPVTWSCAYPLAENPQSS